MIGVPPYSPGDYLDVEEDDDGHVTIRLADYFQRPLRLTPAEGLALLAAGRALLAVPGSDPERTARDRARRSSRTRSSFPASSSTSASPASSRRSATPSPAHDRVEIEYWSAGRDELTTRRIDPEVVFFATGEWYVGAYCHRAHDERMFRVDRIRSVEPDRRDVRARRDRVRDRRRVHARAADDPRVTLELAPAAAWVAEAYPTEAVTERADGSLEIVLAVSEQAWLERLLLRLGPDARVVAPAELAPLAADAAQRILRRYRDDRAPRFRLTRTGRPDTRARGRA